MGDPRSKLQVKLVSFCSVLLKNDAIFCISYTISPFRIVTWVWSILVKRPYMRIVIYDVNDLFKKKNVLVV